MVNHSGAAKSVRRKDIQRNGRYKASAAIVA
jgi:hypothetical protein